jgi:hypothetical protein
MTPSGSTSPGTLRLPARARAVPTPTRVTTRRAPAVAVPLLAVLLGCGVVVAAQATGHWATTGRDATASSTGTGTGTGSQDAAGSAAVAGTSATPASPDDVKGWMSLQQVLDARFAGVTEAGLRAQFAIPVTVGLETPLKELDGVVPGFDLPSLRDWLSHPA